MAHVGAVLRQDSFRGREDSGAENNPTWIAAANTNWTQDVDTDFRIRFLIQETAGADPVETVTPIVEFQVNGGGYADVGTATAVKFGTLTGATDDDPTTQQLGVGTFVTGRLDDDGTVTTADLSNSETEYEYCLNIDSTLVSDGDTIEVRVANANQAIDTYANTPSITANVPTNAVWDQDSFRFYDDNDWDAGTPRAAANTAWTDDPINVFDITHVLRFLIQETAGSNQSETPTFWVQYRVDQGAGFGSWTNVAASNTTDAVRSGVSSLTSGSIGQVLGTGTFRDGYGREDDTTSPYATGLLAATQGNDEYEFAITFEIDSAATTPFTPAAGDTYEFRAVYAYTDIQPNTVPASITNTPVINVNGDNPTIVGHTLASNTTGSDIVLNVPTGAQVDDLLVIIAGVDSQDTYQNAFGIPAGFTEQFGYDTGGGDAAMVIATRVVDGTENASYTVTIDDVNASESVLGTMLLIRGASTTGFPDANTGGGTTDYDFESITTTVDNCLVIGAQYADNISGDPAWTFDSGTGWSTYFQTQTGTGTADGGLLVGQLVQSTAGTTTVGAYSLNGTGTIVGTTFSIAPASGVTGTHAATITAVTSTASGTITKTGTHAANTPLPTTTGSGVLGRSGTHSATITAVTGNASGTIIKTGSHAATITPATSTASGTVAKSGTHAASITPVTGSGTGEVTKTGTHAASITPITSTASGSIGRDGTHAATISPVTGSATGTIVKTGTGSINATVPTTSGTGVMGRSGSGSGTIAPVTGSGSGTIGDAISGTHTASISPATSTASGTITKTGTGSGTTPSVTSSAVGTITKTGTASGTTPSVTSSAVGEITKTGTHAASTSPVTSSATGSVGGAITGTHTASISPVTGSATGEITKVGTHAASISPVTSTASGTITKTGTHAASIAPVTSSATGTVGNVVSGSHAATISPVTGSASGTITKIGTASGTTPSVTSNAAGFITRVGTGDATIATITSSATGKITKTGVGSIVIPIPVTSGTGTKAGAGDGTRRNATGAGYALVSGTHGENAETGSSGENSNTGSSGLNKVT